MKIATVIPYKCRLEENGFQNSPNLKSRSSVKNQYDNRIWASLIQKRKVSKSKKTKLAKQFQKHIINQNIARSSTKLWDPTRNSKLIKPDVKTLDFYI